MEKMEKDDLFSAVRYLNLRELSIGEMEHLIDLFKIKTRQMEAEIRERKRTGKE